MSNDYVKNKKHLSVTTSQVMELKNKTKIKLLKQKCQNKISITWKKLSLVQNKEPTFPTKIGTSMCNALIDTATTKSCISEGYYQKLPSTKIQCLKNISVKSATGSNLTPLGLINCSFELVKIRFNRNFIVCKNLTRPLILGRDFLMQNHITVWYAENGKCVLHYQQHELIVYIDVEDKPRLNMTHSVTLPGRTLIIVCIYNNLDPNQCGYIYEIETM